MQHPDVVWFGEAVDVRVQELEEELSDNCEVFIGVGTSARVHPAAGLLSRSATPAEYFVDPNPAARRLHSFDRSGRRHATRNTCQRSLKNYWPPE
jgi:NAD-dependent deacetylase